MTKESYGAHEEASAFLPAAFFFGAALAAAAFFGAAAFVLVTRPDLVFFKAASEGAWRDRVSQKLAGSNSDHILRS